MVGEVIYNCRVILATNQLLESYMEKLTSQWLGFYFKYQKNEVNFKITWMKGIFQELSKRSVFL